MHRLGAFALALLLVPAALAAAPRSVIGEVETYLSRLEKLGFAGMVIVAEGDEILLAEGYGPANREKGIPWSTTTVSTVGSITKQFTGAAILALAEDGKLSVDDPISDHLPDVPGDKREITLHQLLTHSSGIVDLDGAGDWDPIGREEFVRRSLAQELAFPPGEGYEYSNAGYSLLGAIVERVTGESYEAYLRDRLLVPAGLLETGYLLPAFDDDRLAHGYENGSDWGTVLGRPLADDGPYWVLRANGGIHSTGLDMARWAKALLRGDVLTPASRERLWTPFVDEGGGDSFYGYGWVITEVGGQRLVTHNGGNSIFYADLAILPGSDLVVFLMTNVVSEMNVAGGVMNRVVERLVADEPLPAVPDLASAAPAGLPELAGTYRVEGAPGGEGVLRVTAGQELAIEAMDAPGFSSLLSTRPVDPERVARLTDRIKEIVAAAGAGDFAPLAEAYGNRVTVEDLARSWEERRAGWEETHGAYRGPVVLGTALRDGRDVTLVRYDFAEGVEYGAYVWDPQEEANLLGVSRRGLDPVLHVIPVAGGGFASWDARSGASVPLEFADDRLVLGVGSGRVTARRVTASPTD